MLISHRYVTGQVIVRGPLVDLMRYDTTWTLESIKHFLCKSRTHYCKILFVFFCVLVSCSWYKLSKYNLVYCVDPKYPLPNDQQSFLFQHAQPLKLLHNLFLVLRSRGHVVNVVISGGRNAVDVVCRDDDRR